jgi:hypothetical protein
VLAIASGKMWKERHFPDACGGGQVSGFGRACSNNITARPGSFERCFDNAMDGTGSAR